jgi:hypothetical protein
MGDIVPVAERSGRLEGAVSQPDFSGHLTILDKILATNEPMETIIKK